jgi:hypothetical protein
LIEWLVISHGCLWQVYQLRNKILQIVLPFMVEAEKFSDHPCISKQKSLKRIKIREDMRSNKNLWNRCAKNGSFSYQKKEQ